MLSSFFGLVEIRTKIASVIPLSLGTIYALSHFHRFEIKNFIFMLISLLAFDMVTTALNNYLDFKRARKTHGFNYESHNVIVRDNLKERTVIGIILFLFSAATLFGLLLYMNTDIIVLLIGVLSFLVGICYSFGPVPISRTPFGELLSGLLMGFMIVFLSVYIHIFDGKLISIVYENQNLLVRLEILEILYVFLISLPLVCGIANIMLANNICDVEDDLENRRYTLPVYIGKKNALLLFRFIYYFAYIDLIILCVLGLAPLYVLLALFTVIPVNRNIKVFYEKQTKRDTFVLSVRNFILISLTYMILFGFGAYN